MRKLNSQSLSSTHNNNEADELCVGPFPTLPGDDVPLLWRAHDDLGGSDLLLVQLVVSSQLTHLHLVAAETLDKNRGKRRERRRDGIIHKRNDQDK